MPVTCSSSLYYSAPKPALEASRKGEPRYRQWKGRGESSLQDPVRIVKFSPMERRVTIWPETRILTHNGHVDHSESLVWICAIIKRARKKALHKCTWLLIVYRYERSRNLFSIWYEIISVRKNCVNQRPLINLLTTCPVIARTVKTKITPSMIIRKSHIAEASTCFAFYQVKTKTTSIGPFSFAALFNETVGNSIQGNIQCPISKRFAKNSEIRLSLERARTELTTEKHTSNLRKKCKNSGI